VHEKVNEIRDQVAPDRFWCGQMVDWMTQHMGNRDDWMLNGPMMGNP